MLYLTCSCVALARPVTDWFFAHLSAAPDVFSLVFTAIMESFIVTLPWSLLALFVRRPVPEFHCIYCRTYQLSFLHVLWGGAAL
jgi:hypothetical protein